MKSNPISKSLVLMPLVGLDFAYTTDKKNVPKIHRPIDYSKINEHKNNDSSSTVISKVRKPPKIIAKSDPMKLMGEDVTVTIIDDYAGFKLAVRKSATDEISLVDISDMEGLSSHHNSFDDPDFQLECGKFLADNSEIIGHEPACNMLSLFGWLPKRL